MALAFFDRARIVVRGGGDLASGVIYRLVRAGFPVIVLELDAPLLVRRTVCFGDAVYVGARAVEGLTSRFVADLATAARVIERGEIPVLIDPDGLIIPVFKPTVVIDARMEKHNPDTTIHEAPCVIALGPGFTAGLDCHAVIETNRGHDLGRVIRNGSAEPDSGEPGSLMNKTHSRVLRAPTDGHIDPNHVIGELVQAGDVIATISGHAINAPFTGILRGLMHSHVRVQTGMKVGDLDPRARREHCFTLSDKSLAVGGGALEAVMSSSAVRAYFG